jgi:hypothetical protein
MGRTACTEPQCLYSRAIPLLPIWAVRPVQSLSACTRVHFYISLATAVSMIGSWVNTIWYCRVTHTKVVYPIQHNLRVSGGYYVYNKEGLRNAKTKVMAVWGLRVVIVL